MNQHRQSRRAAMFSGAAAWKHHRARVSSPFYPTMAPVQEDAACRIAQSSRGKTRRAFYGSSVRIAPLPDRRAERAAPASITPIGFLAHGDTFSLPAVICQLQTMGVLEKVGLLTLSMPDSLHYLPKQRLHDFRACSRRHGLPCIWILRRIHTQAGQSRQPPLCICQKTK